MTKEQDEAIKKLEFVNRYYDCFNYYSRYELDCIETALNMLKDLQRENKYMHSELDRQQTTINNYAKEIEKKDKIIYEMLRSFADIGFGFDYCNNDDRCINDCDKCLMQYFERKAKDGRN